MSLRTPGQSLAISPLLSQALPANILAKETRPSGVLHISQKLDREKRERERELEGFPEQTVPFWVTRPGWMTTSSRIHSQANGAVGLSSDTAMSFGERSVAAAGAAVLSAVLVNPLDVAKVCFYIVPKFLLSVQYFELDFDHDDSVPISIFSQY